MSRSAALPPWTLSVPAGGTPGTTERFRNSINSRGLYRLNGTTPSWSVEPEKDPPPCLVQLDWRHTAKGLLGTGRVLRDHLATWPDPALDPATARAALSEFAGRSKPETPLDLADACRVAGIAIGMAQGSILPEIAAGVARNLLEWYPHGQMMAWGRSYEHIMAGRPHHMLAAATLSGWDAIQESLDAGRGHLWFHGEDISISHPGSIYLNLVNEVDLPGVAFETVPVTFVFEFGEYLRMPRLDFVGITYIHSLSAMEYSPAELPEMSGVVQPGSLEQDALREWFVAGFNRLADHLLRWQSFMTRGGELRPVVQQQTNMTVGRLLYVSAHLLASSERAARLADFWQLVDLYRGLRGGGIPDLFLERFWEDTVVAAIGTLPGNLATLLKEHARTLYHEWIDQTLAGVVPPSSVSAAGVAVPYPDGERTLAPAAFLAQHLQERRDTLHGYDLTQPVQAALLGIHNGSLPQRLPEWGRFMLIALLAEPGRIIERRFLKA